MAASLEQEMIKKICVRDNDKILDVGCGTGALLAGLTRWRDAEGYGVDISGEMIRRASEDYPDLHFQVGSSDDLDFEDNTFRIITVCSAFHHFPNQAGVHPESGRSPDSWRKALHRCRCIP